MRRIGPAHATTNPGAASARVRTSASKRLRISDLVMTVGLPWGGAGAISPLAQENSSWASPVGGLCPTAEPKARAWTAWPRSTSQARSFRVPRADGKSPDRPASLHPEGARCPLGLRVLRVHGLQGGPDDPGDGGVAGPFAVGRDHVPGRVRGRATVEHGLVGGLEVVPVRAVLEIAGVELPVL